MNCKNSKLQVSPWAIGRGTVVDAVSSVQAAPAVLTWIGYTGSAVADLAYKSK